MIPRKFPGTNADGPKRRKKKKTAFQKTVDKLDRYFSEFMRLSAMNPETQMCKCVTCPRIIPWKGHGTHLGHFIEKSYTKNMRVRYKLENVGVQCYTCNVTRSGNRYEFSKYVEAKHGPGTCRWLEMYATKPFNEKIFNFPDKIGYYKQKLKSLKAEKLYRQTKME